MEVVKKNLLSIIFGVVALLAVGSLFWPIAGLYADLEKEMADEAHVGSTLNSLSTAARYMPLLSPDQIAPERLTAFPTENVIAAGNEATAQIATEAKYMLTRAAEANQHLPLLPGELPKPDDATRFEFAAEYHEQTTNYARWQKMLDSTTPPTPDEVTEALAKLKDRIDDERLAPRDNPTPASVAAAKAQYDAEWPLVQPRMEQERASQHGIYLQMTPDVLPIDPTITKDSLPEPGKIAQAQITFWIIDDIAQAIARANRDYSDPAVPGGPAKHDILHAAVKQIERIGRPGGVVASAAVDPTAGVDSPTPSVPSISPTGRVCNGLYDVFQFKVNLVVDAAKIPQIVRELEYGQFISVVNLQLTDVIDPAVAAATGFRYGDKPVVRLELDCEELMLRQWIDTLLPDSMKNQLGQMTAGSDQVTPGVPAYPNPYYRRRGYPGYPGGGYGGYPGGGYGGYPGGGYGGYPGGGYGPGPSPFRPAR